MFRKLFVFALMLTVLFSATVQPSYADGRGQDGPKTVVLNDVARSLRELPANYKNFKFVVKGEFHLSSSDAWIGEKYPASDLSIDLDGPPPPTVPYHVWHYLPDWGIWLDCVYDDETGELLYCDIYA